jgi:hypothetical protein
MSKKLICLILSVILLINVSGSISSIDLNMEFSNTELENSNFTHTVFGGIAFTQGCGPCHIWNQEIYEAYESGEFDFQYASMIVYDQDGEVLNRDAYDWDSNYDINTYPTSIFDGDYKRIIGNHPENINETINQCGNRSITELDVNLNISWMGNATVNITAEIKNNDTANYNGSIRAFMTEIVSRYDTSQGDSFHFGFLDFAIEENISLEPGETHINNTNWNGNDHEDEQGNNFGDIIAHNIKLILVVYNNTNGYADSSISANISNTPPLIPSDPYPANGSTGVDVNVDLSWNCEDPEEDPLTYNVYFGDSLPLSKVSDNQTNSTFDPGMLNISSDYYWKIIAWDNYNASSEGPVWNFRTRFNNPPEIPEIPSGPSNGSIGIEYSFSTSTIDLDNDQVFYKWDWGDGNFSDWLGPYIQGTESIANYKWGNSGEFFIRVKAKDIVNAESNWSNSSKIKIVKPEIEIGRIKGGISKINVNIENIGDGEAKNVNWQMNLIGGFILRGFESSGNIDNIPPGEQVNITSNRIFGFGRIDVIVTLELSDETIIDKTDKGLVFLFFILI